VSEANGFGTDRSCAREVSYRAELRHSPQWMGPGETSTSRKVFLATADR
jgi:hypothetical protein